MTNISLSGTAATQIQSNFGGGFTLQNNGPGNVYIDNYPSVSPKNSWTLIPGMSIPVQQGAALWVCTDAGVVANVQTLIGVQASAATITEISGPVDIGEVTLAPGSSVGITGPVAISGTVPISGNVGISGPVTVNGSVGISSGTVNIGTVSGTVDVNGSTINVGNSVSIAHGIALLAADLVGTNRVPGTTYTLFDSATTHIDLSPYSTIYVRIFNLDAATVPDPIVTTCQATFFYSGASVPLVNLSTFFASGGTSFFCNVAGDEVKVIYLAATGTGALTHKIGYQVYGFVDQQVERIHQYPIAAVDTPYLSNFTGSTVNHGVQGFTGGDVSTTAAGTGLIYLPSTTGDATFTLNEVSGAGGQTGLAYMPNGGVINNGGVLINYANGAPYVTIPPTPLILKAWPLVLFTNSGAPAAYRNVFGLTSEFSTF